MRPHALWGPWNSPGQNTAVGSLSLLQGIFPTQGSNPGLAHCRWILAGPLNKGPSLPSSVTQTHTCVCVPFHIPADTRGSPVTAHVHTHTHTHTMEAYATGVHAHLPGQRYHLPPAPLPIPATLPVGFLWTTEPAGREGSWKRAPSTGGSSWRVNAPAPSPFSWDN